MLGKMVCRHFFYKTLFFQMGCKNNRSAVAAMWTCELHMFPPTVGKQERRHRTVHHLKLSVESWVTASCDQHMLTATGEP